MKSKNGVDNVTPYGDSTDMQLKDLLRPLTESERESFAERCNTSIGHLRNIACGVKTCGESLAINIDRESDGKVSCETLRPDVDWQYLRGTESVSRLTTNRKLG